jgi:uncharacterized protein (DUF58 family)
VSPLALVLLVPLALAALAWAQRIYPTRALAAWAIVPALASLALVLGGQLASWLVALDIVFLAAVFADVATLPSRRSFSCAREIGRIASLRMSHPVTLTVSNRSARTLEVSVRDDVPEGCSGAPGEFVLRLPPRSRSIAKYELRPGRRGAFRLENVYLRVASRMKLWQRYLTFSEAHDLHVYPDMRQLREYALLARSNRLSLLGVRRTRRIGQDNEFERLRDYTLDDNYKHIEWRSTARRGKLTVKDFQANQSQRVIFLVDCGRMMTATSQNLSLLDHALNAALMLSYVALRRGDAVGMLCFADGIERYVPPRSGMKQMNRLLHGSFDRFARMVESRYDDAFVYLRTHCPKRSLVVLLTNVVDEVNANQVSQYLTSLVRRHLPLAVLLRDRTVFDAAYAEPLGDDALYRAAAANEIVAWRAGVIADLEMAGVLSLDVFPDQLTVPLVNRYLEIKARHLL